MPDLQGIHREHPTTDQAEYDAAYAEANFQGRVEEIEFQIKWHLKSTDA